MTHEDLGTLFKHCRKIQDLSQKEAATKMGQLPHEIKSYELGRGFRRTAAGMKILEGIGVRFTIKGAPPVVTFNLPARTIELDEQPEPAVGVD